MDRAFYVNKGPYPLSDIILKVLPNNKFDKSYHKVLIHGVDNIENATKNDITYLTNKAYFNGLHSINAAACIIPDNIKHLLPNKVIPIISDNPESTIADIINMFYEEIDIHTTGIISNKAIIDSEVSLEQNVTINHGVIIKKGCLIGNNTYIDSNTVVHNNVRIGRNVYIGSNCSIKNCFIGDNVIIHSGVCIGQDGFGYAINEKYLKKIPHIGKVILQNNVEIGSNSTVDRGSMKDTIIGEGTKIDNQVQIAHNVVIGENCAIAGQVGISGSVVIGNNVMIGGQVGIKQHRMIGDNVQIAAGSGVTRSFSSNKRIAGNPAQLIDVYHKELKRLSRLKRK
jgi:UDP-3-O-[3-hydroxymyristoyl] glucosamine N-acyltransferase